MKRVYLASGLYAISHAAAVQLLRRAGTPAPALGEPTLVTLPRGTRAELTRREFDLRSEFTPDVLRRTVPTRAGRRWIHVWTLKPVAPYGVPPRLRWERAPDGAPIWISKPFTDAFGRELEAIYRVDARRRGGEPVRVDRGTMFGWEAIDDGEVKTIAAGRELANADVRARGGRRDPQRFRRRHHAWRFDAAKTRLAPRFRRSRGSPVHGTLVAWYDK